MDDKFEPIDYSLDEDLHTVILDETDLKIKQSLDSISPLDGWINSKPINFPYFHIGLSKYEEVILDYLRTHEYATKMLLRDRCRLEIYDIDLKYFDTSIYFLFVCNYIKFDKNVFWINNDDPATMLKNTKFDSYQFLGYYIDGMSWNEVGKLFNLSEGNVRTRAKKIIKFLPKFINEDELTKLIKEKDLSVDKAVELGYSKSLHRYIKVKKKIYEKNN